MTPKVLPQRERLVLWVAAAYLVMSSGAGPGADGVSPVVPDRHASRAPAAAAPGGAEQPAQTATSDSLPIGAQASISAVLGRDDARYHAETDPHRVLLTNPVQGLAATFTEDSVSIRSGATGAIHMALTGVGFGEALVPAVPATPVATANRVEYRRGPLTEWYINGPVGLEQGFTLQAPPSGRRDGDPLTLVLALSEQGERAPDAETNVLTWPGGLRYRGLFAVDAEGRELPASLEVDERTLQIRVDERGARYPITIDPFFDVATLAPTDKQDQDGFGTAVAISDGIIVVGAPQYDVHLPGSIRPNQGKVYVFVEPPGGWAGPVPEAAQLSASDASCGYTFGYSVAIDGDIIAVGAPGATTIIVDGEPVEPGAGWAYVFVEPVDGWAGVVTESARLEPSDGEPGDQFGFEIDLSVDTDGSADTIVVGSIFDGFDGQDDRGSAYAFVEPDGGWTGVLTETAKLTGSTSAAESTCGFDVVVSSDTVFVACPEHQNYEGTVYVFDKPSSGWTDATETLTLTAPGDADMEAFGSAVAIEGNTLVIGAALADDGQGAAYVFGPEGEGWAARARLTASEPNPDDAPQLGIAVAISGDTIVLGAPLADVGGDIDRGALYLFTRPDGGWTGDVTETERIRAANGPGSVAIEGGTLVSGERVLVFDDGTGSFPPINNDFADSLGLTGRSAAAVGSNDLADKEEGEPDHADRTGGSSVWYHWRAPATATVTIDTCGSSFDTVLAVYTGLAVDALTMVAANDDAEGDAPCAGTQQSSVTFDADSGVRYLIAIDGVDGVTGNLHVTLEQDEPPDSGWNAVEPIDTETFVLGLATASGPDGAAMVAWRSTATADIEESDLQLAGIDLDGTVGPVHDVTTPEDGGALDHDIAIGPDGRAAVVWRQHDSGAPERVRFQWIAEDGSPTGPAIDLIEANIQLVSPRVVVGPDGTATVVWTRAQELSGPIPGEFVVEGRRVSPDGELGPQFTLSDDTGDLDDRPDLTMAPDGMVTVAWSHNSEAHVLQWAPDAEPGEIRRLSEPGESARATQVSASPDGAVTAVWAVVTEGAADTIRARHLAPDGALGEVATLSTGGVDGREFRNFGPALDVGPDGTAFVVWERTDEGSVPGAMSLTLHGRTYGPDGTLGDLQVLSVPSEVTSAGPSFEAQVAIDRWGNTTVTWGRFNGASIVAQARRITAEGEVGPIADLSPPGRAAFGPRLVAGVDGTATAAWYEAPRSLAFYVVTAAQLPAADLSIAATVEGDFEVGRPGLYTMTVTNEGIRESVATAEAPITVTSELPSGLEGVDAVGDGWACSIDAPTVTCTRDTSLPPGPAPAIEVTVDVTRDALPGVSLAVSASPGETVDPNTPNNTASDAAMVDLPAPVVSIDEGPAALTHERTAMFVFRTDQEDATMACAVDMGSFEPCESPVVLSNLEEGSHTFTVRATGATDKISEPATWAWTVEAVANLRLTKTLLGELVAGEEATYELALANGGPWPAEGPITLTDVLPDDLTFLSASGDGWTCVDEAGSVTCNRGELAVDATSPLTLVVAVAPEATGSITNEATVTAATTDPEPDNNLASATATVDTGADTFTQYFAEGATAFFTTTLGLFNPDGDDAAQVELTLLPEVGQPVAHSLTLGPRQRTTVALDDLLPAGSGAVSSVIESDMPVVADRLMTWPSTAFVNSMAPGALVPDSGRSLERAVAEPSETWYFAEGATAGPFDLFYLFENLADRPVTATVTYLRQGDTPLTREYVLPPESRQTVWVDGEAGLEHALVAAAITADGPIVAERAMYLSVNGQFGVAGHAAAGVGALADTWSFAEGATGAFFDTFLLFGNPHEEPVTVDVQYHLPNSETIDKTYQVAAAERLTVYVDAEDPALSETSVAAHVTASAPIVAERAMWWPGPTAGTWAAASAALGATAPAERWAIAEAHVGTADPLPSESFVLIANATATATPVRVTVITNDGTTVEQVVEVAGRTRRTLALGVAFPALAGEPASVLVESLDDAVPITVEHASYSSTPGQVWAAGAAALATPLR